MRLPVQTLKFLALIGVLAILGGIGAAAFFFGGFFNVGADHPDPDIVNWALVHVRKVSIARHATDQPPGSLGPWCGPAQAPIPSAAASFVMVGLA
jgi:hypothetical protein